VFRVSADGERLAEAAGRLKHEAGGREALPVVGDWVALRPDTSGARSQIREVLTRRTWFSRKVAGRLTLEQVLAANIDTVFVVFAIDDSVNVRAIERYLVAARRSGARAVVVLNKADLAADLGGRVAEASVVAREVLVVASSARTGLGLDVLEGFLGVGQTIALLGPSGAGKSSLVNGLVGQELLPTGEVRPWDSRGRHTSVIGSSWCARPADSSSTQVSANCSCGIRTPWTRPSMTSLLATACRFRDCRHGTSPAVPSGGRGRAQSMGAATGASWASA
jgi:ribosome biogenesis GTPase